MARNEVREDVDAFFGAKVNDLGAVFAQPIDAAAEIDGLSHDDSADAKLANQTATVPTGRQGGHHDFVVVTAVAARLSKSIRFAMHGRIAFLHSAVAAASQQLSFAIEQRGTNGNASFGEAEASFLYRYFQHGEILLTILVRVCSHFFPSCFSAPSIHFGGSDDRKHPGQEK